MTHVILWEERGYPSMVGRADRIRLSVQKLTEAIWNLDQLEPLEPELKVHYSRIQEARAYLIKLIKDEVERTN